MPNKPIPKAMWVFCYFKVHQYFQELGINNWGEFIILEQSNDSMREIHLFGDYSWTDKNAQRDLDLFKEHFSVNIGNTKAVIFEVSW